MIAGLHHVGVLVADFHDIETVLGERLGLTLGTPTAEPELGIEVLWANIGDTRIELIRPLSPTSRAAEQLRAGRGGVHHVAFAVDDLDDCLAELQSERVPLIDSQPRPGAGNTRIAFIDSSAAGGALLELVETKDRSNATKGAAHD